MTIGKALAIFLDIENPIYTVLEKGYAISRVIGMATHNGIKKDDLIKALNWLLHEHYDTEYPYEFRK